MINVYDLEENADTTLGIGWYRANWMPDNKSAVANGLIGREQVMVRLSLTVSPEGDRAVHGIRSSVLSINLLGRQGNHLHRQKAGIPLRTVNGA